MDVSEQGYGGEGGIRTLDTLARMLVFKTSAFNHSATSPAFGELTELVGKFQYQTNKLIGY